MNELQIFNNEEFGEIRTVTKNNKTYFAGSDVASALGYAIPHKAVQTHCKGVLKWNIPTKSGNQDVLFIPEGDVYRLIMRSKLPAAEFQSTLQRGERQQFAKFMELLHGISIHAPTRGATSFSPKSSLFSQQKLSKIFNLNNKLF